MESKFALDLGGLKILALALRRVYLKMPQTLLPPLCFLLGVLLLIHPLMPLRSSKV